MNHRTISALTAALFLGASAVALGPAGCGPSSGSLCNKVCDCTGCSEVEQDDCVDTLDDARKAASKKGCGDKYDDYLSCIDGELTCVEDHLDADGCELEAEEVGECMNGSLATLPGADPCLH